jgi:hypothetical protein
MTILCPKCNRWELNNNNICSGCNEGTAPEHCICPPYRTGNNGGGGYAYTPQEARQNGGYANVNKNEKEEVNGRRADITISNNRE